MFTERLELRPPTELDRSRFVSLFQDHDFMVFSGEVHDRDSANARFWFEGSMRLEFGYRIVSDPGSAGAKRAGEPSR